MRTIVIADPHTLCREAMCDYIRHADQDFRITGYQTLDGLQQDLKTGAPDLLLIDGSLANGETDGFVQGWKQTAPQMQVCLMLPAVMHDPLAVDQNNLAGIFPKTLSSKEFLQGIYEILSGGKFFPALPRREEMGTTRASSAAPVAFNLTAREKEVLSYLMKGASNKDIARALDLQVVTVKLHVRGICRKMQASNRTQAALIAREQGWR